MVRMFNPPPLPSRPSLRQLARYLGTPKKTLFRQPSQPPQLSPVSRIVLARVYRKMPLALRRAIIMLKYNSAHDFSVVHRSNKELSRMLHVPASTVDHIV